MSEIEADIGGKRYRLILKPWPYKVGRKWAMRLVRMSMGGTAGVDGMLDMFSEAQFADFVDTCETHTDAVLLEGEGKAVPFKELTPLLRDSYHVTGQVVRGHAEGRFGPFVDWLKNAFGDPAAPNEEGGGQ